eukprot:COSAG01_NODE_1613_length_9731_cov_11.760590_11_plen_110_part_00
MNSGELSCVCGGRALEPVSFGCVLVAVRCDGHVEWDVLTPAQYAQIKQSSQHGDDGAGAGAIYAAGATPTPQKKKRVCRAAHKLLVRAATTSAATAAAAAWRSYGGGGR